MLGWLWPGFKALFSGRTRESRPTDDGQPATKTEQQEDTRVERVSLSPPRGPASRRTSSRWSSPYRRSQSTSPTARDSTAREIAETARRSDVARSIRDVLSQAASSSIPAEYMRTSLGDRSIDLIDDWLSRNPDDKLWSGSLQLLRTLCRELARGPPALYLNEVEFDPGRDPTACGAYTDVYCGKFDGGTVAVKRVRIAGGPTDRESYSKHLIAEAAAWRHLKHSNLVQFFGVVQDQNTHFAIIHTVTPWVTQGTLLNYIKSASYDASTQRVQLLSEVAGALEYLHSLAIIHGDLKFTNVLVDAEGHAQVMDFGLSMIVGPSFAGESAASGNSARWMGPEFVADLDTDETPRPTPKSDVFSFGRLIYAVATKREPLQHMRSDVAVVLFLQSGRQPPRPTADHCDGVPMSDALWELTLDCWKGIPEERPDMLAIVQRLNTSQVR